MDDVARIPLDAETKVAERPHDHKDELRLWLRLFTCKEVIETEVRRRLRDSFEVTLPRFDLLAQRFELLAQRFVFRVRGRGRAERERNGGHEGSHAVHRGDLHVRF